MRDPEYGTRGVGCRTRDPTTFYHGIPACKRPSRRCESSASTPDTQFWQRQHAQSEDKATQAAGAGIPHGTRGAGRGISDRAKRGMQDPGCGRGTLNAGHGISHADAEYWARHAGSAGLAPFGGRGSARGWVWHPLARLLLEAQERKAPGQKAPANGYYLLQPNG